MNLIPFSGTLRGLNRLRAIVLVLTRHGFGHLVSRMRLHRFVPFRKKILKKWATPEGLLEKPSVAARAARVLEELGPTFVKLGQMLSSRPDLLSENFILEFRKLQDRVSPFPAAEAREIIQDELGAPVEELFAAFDDVPCASGSIAQVHLARTSDGQDVVVKVRRPGILQTVLQDIELLQRLAGLVERYMPEYRTLGPTLLVDEFARTIQREMDFITEASSTAKFHEKFQGDPNVCTPRVRWDLTSSGVLTLERMEGINLQDTDALAKAGVDRRALAKNIAKAFMKQYFEFGLFHADPHPGNLLAQPQARISIMDFGMVGRLSINLRTKLGTALIAVLHQEFDVVVDVLDDLGCLPDEIDEPGLKSDLAIVLGKYAGIPMERIDIKLIFDDVMEISRRHHIVLPRNFVLLGKSLVTLAGVARQLDPQVNLVDTVGAQIRRLITSNFAPDRIARRGLVTAYQLGSLAEETPQALRQILRKALRGKLQMLFRHEGLDHLVTELDRSTNRLAFSLIVAAIILASSVIMLAKVGWLLPGTNIPLLGFLGYIVAGILGIWLLMAILRSGKM